jgi:hypothetical protein
MSRDPLADRLEMLLVLAWLDQGSPPDGAVSFSVASAAHELGLGSDRTGLLAVMSALSSLEDAGLARPVKWPFGSGSPARVELAESIRRDARTLFEGPTA